ncbi:hypothetical protein GF361_00850 [Candidatus Woesearchaeota archaeon]|nr:hypothetical protein [Candidatus Woesearchaeota archaeon]
MKCYLCGGNGDIKQQKGRSVCKACFCRLLEKRIRKHARVNKLFSKDDRILVTGDVNKYLVKSILKDLPVKLFFKRKEDKKFIKEKNINKVVVEWTMDDENNRFMKGIFNDESYEKMPEKYVKLLIAVTDDEIKKFAEIKKLDFKENKKDKDVQGLLDKVEKKHPNIKYNLLRNIKGLNKLTDGS